VPRNRPIALAALLILGASVPPARASIVRHLSIKELAAAATVVVIGEVRTVEAAWVGKRIMTTVRVDAASVLRGPVKAGQPVIVVVPGGEVDGIGQWVPGAPRFKPGERVLLFLVDRPVGRVVVGLGLGRLGIHREADGGEIATRDEGPTLGPGLTIPLAEVRRLVTHARPR